jgi:hypothetical protein
MPRGFPAAAISATTLSLATSMIETVPDPSLLTQASGDATATLATAASRAAQATRNLEATCTGSHGKRSARPANRHALCPKLVRLGDPPNALIRETWWIRIRVS